jgi:hypothetical protein
MPKPNPTTSHHSGSKHFRKTVHWLTRVFIGAPPVVADDGSRRQPRLRNNSCKHRGNMSEQFDSDPRHRSNCDPRKVDWRHAICFCGAASCLGWLVGYIVSIVGRLLRSFSSAIICVNLWLEKVRHHGCIAGEDLRCSMPKPPRLLRAVLDQVCENVCRYKTTARTHVVSKILEAATRDETAMPNLKQVGRRTLSEAPTTSRWQPNSRPSSATGAKSS